MAKKESGEKDVLGHVVVRKFVAYGKRLDQGVRVDATDWPKLTTLLTTKYLRAATLADMDRRLVEVKV